MICTNIKDGEICGSKLSFCVGNKEYCKICGEPSEEELLAYIDETDYFVSGKFQFPKWRFPHRKKVEVSQKY